MILERVELEDADIVVVAQKAISKIEGRVVRLDDVEPSQRAIEIAGDEDDPRRVEGSSARRSASCACAAPLVICETGRVHLRVGGRRRVEHARAGNARPAPGRSRRLGGGAARASSERTGRDVGVIVTDSFGRPWRQGTTDVAIGAAGVEVMRDLNCAGGHL